MAVEIKCQVCGKMVDEKSVFRSKINETYVVGHKECLDAKIKEKGLFESAEAQPQQTGILFE